MGWRLFFFDCIAICFLTGFFFSSSFFKRLQANISPLAPTRLLEVSLWFLPTSVVIYSSGLYHSMFLALRWEMSSANLSSVVLMPAG
jgi:hypothetical protein